MVIPTGRSVLAARLVVLGVAGAVLLAKAWLAWRTQGQEDTTVWWPAFMGDVQTAGPVGVYGLAPAGQVYNHPPLTGWWLVALGLLKPLAGPHLGYFIRIGSVVADFLCAWVIFEVLRLRRPVWAAAAAGMLVGASPVLYVISGYHGNHDPEMMFLAILSAFLLVDLARPAAAGVALATAVSLKLPAAVVVPVVFAAALAQGWPRLRRFAAGFGAVIVVLWVPPLLEQTVPFVHNVLLYSANSFPRQWGPVEFARALGLPDGVVDGYVSSGRLILLALCGLAGAWFAWRRPDLTVAAIGLTMAAFLLLSPGYAPQYMVWPVAASYALAFWPATAYNLTAGAFLVGLYTWWSGGIPWDATITRSLTGPQVVEAAVTWLALGWVVVNGAITLSRAARLPRPSSPRPTRRRAYARRVQNGSGGRQSDPTGFG